MLFKRKAIAKHKVDIWDQIHLLQKDAQKQSVTAGKVINDIYESFNELTGLDPDIKHHNKEVERLFAISLNILEYISANYRKDPDFECLKTPSNLLNMRKKLE